jgi:hypothetical protein
MAKIHHWISLGCCILGAAAFAHAQSQQQPGLWETTTTMTMAGMPQMAQGPFGAPRTSQVCVTQAMVDKFGGPYSSPPRGDCQMTNRSVTPTGMTMTMSCSGQFTGTGTVDVTITAPGATEMKMHLIGTAQGGNGSHPVDMTMQMKSAYKGPDCGSVKPLPMPAEK